jgi:dihydroorotate dehydrogenase (fumarate)
MINLSTKYMGLDLRNPIIVASSSLTSTLDKIKQCADAGAGAIVLKSLFEEQIHAEGVDLSQYSQSLYDAEAADWLQNYNMELGPTKYLQLIEDAKKAVSIPVIASLNCFSTRWWLNYAKKIEAAGADAIELNFGVIFSDSTKTGKQVEDLYIETIKQVKKRVKVPIALKIGPYFSSFANIAEKLSRGEEEATFFVGWSGGKRPAEKLWDGVDALVLFNRYYCLDIDIDNMTLKAGNPYSSPEEIHLPLRWISLLSGRVKCDLAATTGVHDGEGAIKQILTGATAVQLCSTLYKNGLPQIGKILNQIEDWMKAHNFSTLDQFRGKLRQLGSENPQRYERLQYIKLLVGIE